MLDRERIGLAFFEEAVQSLNSPALQRRWRPAIDAAFKRLSFNAKRMSRLRMMLFYSDIDDFESAAQFISFTSSRAGEMLVAMRILVQLSRIEDAKRVARMGEAALKIATDPDSRRDICDALALRNAVR